MKNSKEFECAIEIRNGRLITCENADRWGMTKLEWRHPGPINISSMRIISNSINSNWLKSISNPKHQKLENKKKPPPQKKDKNQFMHQQNLLSVTRAI